MRRVPARREAANLISVPPTVIVTGLPAVHVTAGNVGAPAVRASGRPDAPTFQSRTGASSRSRPPPTASRPSGPAPDPACKEATRRPSTWEVSRSLTTTSTVAQTARYKTAITAVVTAATRAGWLRLA